MSTRVRIAVVVASVVLLAAGCQRAAQQQKPTVGPTAGQMVNVVAKEFAFEPRDIKVKAGMVRFLVQNEGTVEHEFMIEGVTAHEQHASETFQPGVTHEVAVELKPGTYTVACNVAGHREAGMVGRIIVE